MPIDYIHLETIDSTNNWVKKHYSSLKSYTCVTAREQTAGRGRFERKWVSPLDQNIYATLYLTIPQNSSYLSNIGQLMAFSCVKVLKQEGFSALVKWPNDILIDTKKAGGVLTETISSEGVLVGIGLNVNMEKSSLDQIDQVATSLFVSSGKKWDLHQVLYLVMNQFLQDFEILKKEGFKPFQAPFQASLAYLGESITCRNGSETLQGTCRGITADGRLELVLNPSQSILLSAGEVVKNDKSGVT